MNHLEKHLNIPDGVVGNVLPKTLATRVANCMNVHHWRCAYIGLTPGDVQNKRGFPARALVKITILTSFFFLLQISFWSMQAGGTNHNLNANYPSTLLRRRHHHHAYAGVLTLSLSLALAAFPCTYSVVKFLHRPLDMIKSRRTFYFPPKSKRGPVTRPLL